MASLGFPQSSGVGSSNKTLTIIPPKKYVADASSLFTMLPQHYALLVTGPDTVAVENSRKRLASTMAAGGIEWETAVERVKDCFSRHKLRHVDTEEAALSELEKAKRYYVAAQLDM